MPGTNDTSALIHASSLSYTYRGSFTPAIEQISLSLTEGTLYGLIGPNGAGKTTLISLLTTLLRPDQGTLTVCGENALSHFTSIRQVLGAVPQELAIYERLTGRENLLYFGRLYGLHDELVKEKSRYYLDMFGLADKADCRVSTYSGGMKRRINLIIGLLHDPKILFLDEPTAGVDAQSRHLIIEKLRMLNTNGMTMVYASHYLEEIEQLCTSVVLIDHGRIVAQGSPLQLGQADGCTGLADFYLHKTGEKLRD
ncbi:MAG: ABC transporter ATP-binding protein [Desulfopila sp.]|jgi:ABC-2 type transport system ATP-binding protein|nr:ABC transporter ATP-binding protein [Desulfopila sp.]